MMPATYFQGILTPSPKAHEGRETQACKREKRDRIKGKPESCAGLLLPWPFSMKPEFLSFQNKRQKEAVCSARKPVSPCPTQGFAERCAQAAKRVQCAAGLAIPF